MSVTPDDVKHVASLARLGMTDERAREFTAQLNTILSHMDVLARVDTDRVEPVVGIGAESAPLAPDAGPSVPLARAVESIAPAMRDGFFLVPRLASHETTEAS
jgi:aspartyl-tRNA(Asn)/glutamyl-tRNA(Gln) amidotransferase subunit C